MNEDKQTEVHVDVKQLVARKGPIEKLLQSYKVEKERNHGVVVDVGMCIRRNEGMNRKERYEKLFLLL
ncbi:hypothetical protein P8452_56409 [Trifolium repens]|nr:hypothetical protein P8452_56409 [Trifolium repens]